MKLKLAVALLALAASHLVQAGEADVYPCFKMAIGFPGQYNYFYVCGEVALSRDPNLIGKARSETVRATYTNQAGQQMVGTFNKYIRHTCKDGICAEATGSDNAPFSGHAPDGTYYVQLDYYLSPTPSGEGAAYRTGTGPLFGGTASAPANGLTGEACYEQKMADFRKENGEDAMIIHDQIAEWEQQCGLSPSQ
ncbi:TPA: hypothetical protein ACKR1B_003358 [Pseudomonas aeruginosa]|uniref:hypothetical protein n=1 Tax=Pseudomonas aeruginosa TaxID=287 RepID=UPI000F54C2B7|nr:hypothetical protein [Pseudomonas aeruginosa]ELH7348761.1 hypothetical protein [Pseudomonas aeruginosa]ELO2038777.1 hypothetical protein [Pseudomonas aeruginosa]KAB5405662.1 hypothetical protein F8139_29015 [Pseudomonas aeruginosa]MCO2142477.1 hypothetical protein [Pseudomonas aeruginosa]MCO2172132.1 hypothetical protein [Pseudomonas aeruginosa]